MKINKLNKNINNYLLKKKLVKQSDLIVKFIRELNDDLEIKVIGDTKPVLRSDKNENN